MAVATLPLSTNGKCTSVRVRDASDVPVQVVAKQEIRFSIDANGCRYGDIPAPTRGNKIPCPLRFRVFCRASVCSRCQGVLSRTARLSRAQARPEFDICKKSTIN